MGNIPCLTRPWGLCVVTLGHVILAPQISALAEEGRGEPHSMAEVQWQLIDVPDRTLADRKRVYEHRRNCLALEVIDERYILLYGRSPLTCTGFVTPEIMRSLRDKYSDTTSITIQFRDVIFEGNSVEQLSTLNRLESLIFVHTSLNDSDLIRLAGLKDLKWLTIVRSMVTERAVSELPRLTGLKGIVLQSNSFFPKLSEGTLRKQLPDAKVQVLE